MNKRQRFSPPWEVIDLVANVLDPKTLVIASCVSKLWSSLMSADHHWQNHCSAFPSITNLHPFIPFQSIYTMGHSSALRRLQPPPTPSLSLDKLLLSITFFPHATTIIRSFDELEKDPNGLFRFSFTMKGDDDIMGGLLMKEDCNVDFKVSCNVITKGYKSVFTLLENKAASGRMWFKEELPSPSNWFNNGSSGLVAEIHLGFCKNEEEEEEEEEGERVMDVSFDVMNVSTLRYATVDDALRYLQHFLLLPCAT